MSVTWRVLSIAALVTSCSISIAQDGLPDDVQADILKREVIDELKANRFDRVLTKLAEIEVLDTPYPVSLRWIEARIANQLGKHQTAFYALQEFMKTAKRDSDEYASAVSKLSRYQSAANETLTVCMQTTLGSIDLKLDGRRSPRTVDHFLSLVDRGHYNETLFHRVVANFMIQGGGYGTDFELKEEPPIVINESRISSAKNKRGTIAMARIHSKPHSATSQFFINVRENPHIDGDDVDWGYTVFGYVTSGMEIVDQIAAVKTGTKGGLKGNVPKEDVVIEQVSRCKTPGD